MPPLERPVGLVATATRADGDERHSLGPGDRLAGLLRVEAQEGAEANGHLLAVDAPDSVAGDDDVHLFLLGLDLVVLGAFTVRRQDEPVDPEGFDPEPAADERMTPVRPSPSSSSAWTTLYPIVLPWSTLAR